MRIDSRFSRAGRACLLALAAVAASQSATAQVKSLDEQEAVPAPAGETKLSWSLGLNPSWGNRLDVDDDPITNENAAKFTLGARHSFPQRSYIGVTIGAQANPKFASSIRVPGAAAFVQALVGHKVPIGSPELKDNLRDVLDVNGSWKLQRGFKDDDDPATDDDYTDHQIGAEVSFKNIRWYREKEDGSAYPSAFNKITAGFARVLSNRQVREKSTLLGTFDWGYAFHERFPDINLQGAVERSWYDEPVEGLDRADTTWALFGGLDVQKYVSPRARVREATAGVKLAHNNSNIESKDDTSIVFQIGLKFGN